MEDRQTPPRRMSHFTTQLQSAQTVRVLQRADSARRLTGGRHRLPARCDAAAPPRPQSAAMGRQHTCTVSLGHLIQIDKLEHNINTLCQVRAVAAYA